MIIDCFTFNGEYDILEIRLNILNDYVDKFIICESPTTFTGLPKLSYFELMKLYNRLDKFLPKINYYWNEEDYSDEEIELAQNSPNTQGARHWKREFMQKERIHTALEQAEVKDSDIVFIGDVDEVWDPKQLPSIKSMLDTLGKETVLKLKLDVYANYLNQHSNEKFWGTIVGYYISLKDKVLNHLRSNHHVKTETDRGWHFTSMGGLQEVRRKLNDSYTYESYNTFEVQQKLPERLNDGIDYLGRNFKFTTDETNWPQYLKDNREKYKHLLK